MAKLGYTWYPKDWGNSESVFELNLSERGLYRELIDLAMLNDNKTEIKLDVWSRKFAIDIDSLKSILGKLSILNLVEINSDNLFIPSCESRLKLVRGGSNGGKKSKPTPKPIAKPFESLLENNEKPIANQIEIETKIEKKVNNIDERKLKFASTLKPFVDVYGKDFLNDFYKYWTEPNKSNTKFKQELEKTWSLERRLETWQKNDKNFNKNVNQQKYDIDELRKQFPDL